MSLISARSFGQLTDSSSVIASPFAGEDLRRSSDRSAFSRQPAEVAAYRWSSGALGARPLLDPGEPPDGHRDHPGRKEQADDHIAEHVDVDVLEPTPERPREVQPRGNQSAQLDRADDERDSDRPAGDDQVVEDLANRFATEKVISVTQLALAWLLAQGQDIVPTPGTRSPERLAENAAAADVELTDGDLARVAEILPDGAFGSRYPEAMMPKW